MMLSEKSMPAARGRSARRPYGIRGNEGGFALAFVLFVLAICTVLGLSASQISIDELDISSNEVVSKKVFTLALSGMALAAIPLISTQARGAWATTPTQSVFLDDADPELTADSGVIEIIDGQFLYEGPDNDAVYLTGPNNWTKYLSRPVASIYEPAFRPVDDPFVPESQKEAAAAVFGGTDDLLPDLRIRADNLLVLDIDVDKTSVGYQTGGVAEFGSGAEGSAGAAYKIVYLFDCKSTLPAKDMSREDSPKAEVLLGYRFLPEAGL